MGRPITIDGTEFLRAHSRHEREEYDFLIAPTTVTPERARDDALLQGLHGNRLHVPAEEGGQGHQGLEDLKGKTITVNKGSAYETWAKANGEKYGFKFDVYGTNADAVQAVLSGRADANMAGHTVVLWAAKQNPMVKATYTYKTGLVWAMPFRLDDKEGRAQVNMVLKCMKLDGTVARLYEKWFGIKPAADSWVYKVAPGHGVPGMDGYDPTPVTPKCS
jgi:polar amino acid transport system substrate-binding protein